MGSETVIRTRSRGFALRVSQYTHRHRAVGITPDVHGTVVRMRPAELRERAPKTSYAAHV
jgi:hypothetical protein